MVIYWAQDVCGDLVDGGLICASRVDFGRCENFLKIFYMRCEAISGD